MDIKGYTKGLAFGKSRSQHSFGKLKAGSYGSKSDSKKLAFGKGLAAMSGLVKVKVNKPVSKGSSIGVRG